MKAYGIRKKDIGCCPGHSKYSGWPERRSTVSCNKIKRSAKKKERRNNKIWWS